MIDLQSELAQSFVYQKTETANLEVQMQIPSGLTYFVGHFPDFPVLPAVALIDITSYLIKTLLLEKPELSIKKIIHLKLKAAVKPKEKVNIKVLQNKDLTYSAYWSLQDSPAQELAEFTFLF